MADQFVLKGVKELRDYTYTGSSAVFAVKNNPRGGDTWQIPQWWAKKGNNIQYNSCTVLDLVGTDYLMVIPTSLDTQLMVTYDDDVYNIKFSNSSAVDRIAITGKDTKKIVVEYLLPSISGGAIAKRILQTPATIGDFTITGKGAVDVGQSTQYQSNATPDADDATYAWTVLSGGSVVPTGQAEVTAGATASGCTVNWKAAGTYAVRCVVSSDTASDSPKTDDRAVTCSTVQTVGTVEVTGSATPEAEKTSTYTASVTGNNVSDLTYSWSVLDANAQVANPGSSATGITFDAAGNATVQCIVGSDSIADSDSDTLAVVVSTAKKIGVVSIEPSNPTVTAATAQNFQCQVDGNIVDATYQWTVAPADGTFNIATATAQDTDITFNAAGSYEVRCEVSSATAQDSPQTTAPTTTTVTGIPDMPSVSLGGPTTVDTLNVGKNYTSDTTDGSTLSGTTTYQWTATDDNSGETTGIGATINTPNAQNTSVTFTAAAEGRTIALRCKYFNAAYADSPRTGKRNVDVNTGG